MSARVPVDRRRAELLQRSGELRGELGYCATTLRARLRPVDEATRFFRRHAGKLVLGSAALLLLLRGPRRLVRMAGPVAIAWPLLRRWLPTLAALALRPRAGSGD